MAMCQKVVCTFLFSLMVYSGYGTETPIIKNYTNVNLKITQSSNKSINGSKPAPKLIAQIFNTRKFNYENSSRKLKHRTLNSSTLRNRTLNSPTLRTRILKSPVLNAHTINLFKLNKRTLNSPTLRTRTLNSPIFKGHTINLRKLNKRTLNTPTLRTRTLNSPILNGQTISLRKLNKRTLNSPTLETRTLNPPIFKGRTINLRMLNKRTLNISTLGARTFKPPSLNAQILNYETLNPPKDGRTPKNEIEGQIYDERLEDWLEDTNVISPDEDYKDFRRSHIEGLHDFKNIVKKNKEKSRKRSEDFIHNDIILNDKYEVDSLREHAKAVPNFNETFADEAAKKLHKIQSEYLKHKLKEEELKSARRNNDYYYYSDELTTKKPNPKDRIFALMDQFLFQSQKKLINAQLLRNKYVIYVKFKIGYVFSLLRILKQQQLRIYSSMHFYRFYTPTVDGTWYEKRMADTEYYINLYEKLTRLDDDIVTLVSYLWQLEELRKKEAAIDATKFPKRKKFTPALQHTYYITLPSYYGK